MNGQREQQKQKTQRELELNENGDGLAICPRLGLRGDKGNFNLGNQKWKIREPKKKGTLNSEEYVESCPG